MIARVEPAALARELKQTLRITEDDERDEGSEKHEVARQTHLRPETTRRITYPDPSSQTNTGASQTALTTAASQPYVPVRPRNKSPYRPPHTPARPSHLRSRSSGSLGVAPPMTRAHSSPIVPSVHSAGSYTGSPAASPRTHPLRSPALRSLSPFQPLLEDGQSSYDGAIQSISEDAELDIKPRSSMDQIPQPVPLHATLNSARPLSVRRQRPTSPLHSLANTSASYTPSRSSSGSSSPSLSSGRFNEGYPTLHHYGSTSSFSSVPSTPTSTRSRSPSVSSLDTIEDTPDLEWEAIEADRAAKAAAAAAAAAANQDGETSESRRRGSLDIPGARSGAGFGFGRRGDNSKKRWSVCGGERRADLDLETIWED